MHWFGIKKEEKEKAKSVVLSTAGVNILSDAAKDHALRVVMHDRLYEIEKKYAAALVTARHLKAAERSLQCWRCGVRCLPRL